MSNKLSQNFFVKRNKFDGVERIRNSFHVLLVIFSISLVLRVYFTEFEIPLTQDGLLYFWYANDLAQNLKFPSEYIEATNNGWPSFIGLFFTFFEFSSYLDQMALQRILSIVISSSTIFPIYFLIKKFTTKNFAIIGSTAFIFEPRIFMNSTLGLTEPLSILILSLILFLILNNKFSHFVLGFSLLAVDTLIRIENIFLIFPIVIYFFINNKIDKKNIVKICGCIILLFLIIFPMLNIRNESIGQDGFLSRFTYSLEKSPQLAINRGISDGDVKLMLFLGVENFLKFLAYSMIPIFLIFTPIGFIFLITNNNKTNRFLIFCVIFLLIPLIYAFSVASDFRYLFPLYPIFAIAFAVFFQKVFTKIKLKMVIGVLFAIIITSFLFIELKDDSNEIELVKISKIVYEKIDRINLNTSIAKYLPIAKLDKLENYPITRTDYDIPFRLTDFGEPINQEFSNIDEIMEFFKKNNTTHLVLDENTEDIGFLSDVFNSKNESAYFKKIYDAENDGFNYQLKIFIIDFDLWENNKK